MRTDRNRQYDSQVDLDLADDDAAVGSAAFLAQTVSAGNYPNTATSMYGIQLVGVDVEEVEGATPTFTADTSQTLYALNLGSNVPNTGTTIIVHAVGGRLSFRFDG